MATLCDGCRSDHGEVVEETARFSGRKHDFLLPAKVDIPRGIVCRIRHNLLKPPARLAVLLGCGAAQKPLDSIGLAEIESDHFLLFPRSGRVTRAIERRLSGWPPGARHARSARP